MERRGRLAEQVTVKRGPRKRLTRYFESVDDWLGDLGLCVFIRWDFDRLMRLNLANRDSWLPLMPFNDPRFHDLGNGTAFWMDVHDRQGDTIMTHSARIFDWSETTLAREIRSLRLLYAEPNQHAAAGDEIEVIDAPSAPHITGRVALLGSKWIRPDYRGLGIAKIVSGATRAASCALWDPNYVIGFIEPKVHRLGVTRVLGDYYVEEGVVFPLVGRGKVPHMLVWMKAESALREIAAGFRSVHKRPVAQQRDTQAVFVTAAPLPG